MSSSRAVLYTFSQSVWASLPNIILKEKGYNEDDIERKNVNLRKGEQYSKEYLNINGNGTVPTLVVPVQEASSSGATRYQAITGSIPILEFLDKSKGRTGLTAVSQGAADGPSSNYGGSLPASAEVETRAVSNEGIVLTPATIGAKRESDEVIRVLQSADGNAILFGFLDKTERDFKQKLFQQAFVDRMEALVKYFEEAKEEGGPQAQSRISFYEKTLEKYAPLAASYNALPASFSTSQGQEGAFNQNTASNLVIQKIEAECEKLSEMFQKLEGMVKLPYALGDQFSIADVAAMAVLARFAFIAKLRRAASSGTSPQSDREPLTSFVGLPANVSVGPKIQTYTSHLMSRQSFKDVYADGLH